MGGSKHNGHKWLPFVLLAIILLFTQWLEYSGWLAGPSGHFADMLLSRESPHSGARPQRPVVTVEIDDDAYTKCFAETSPMNPKRIEQLVALIAMAKPPVIGVDILTESQIHTDEYHMIADKFRKIDTKIIWAAGAREARIHVAPYFPWLMGVQDEVLVDPTRILGYERGAPQLDPPYWAVPLFPRDDDATIRRLPLDVKISADVDRPDLGQKAPHWTHIIASNYCMWLLQNWHYTCPAISSDEILIPYGGQPPFEFRMDQFFRCDSRTSTITYRPGFQKVFEDTIRDRVVLIGGTFGSSGDFHESPIGRIPGLRVNAYAVQAQVEGGGMYAVEQPLAWILDLLLGLSVIFLYREGTVNWVVHRFKRLENYEGALLLSGGFVLGLLLLLFAAIYLWWSRRYLLGLLPMGLGMFVEQFVHIHIHAHSATSSKHKGHSSRPAPHPE